MPDLTGWLVLAGAALLASTIGGVAGFGAGVIMIPVVAWTLGVKATVPVLTVAMLIGNLARVWFSRREVEGAVVRAFLLGGIPASALGALAYSRIDGEWISRILGAFMLLAVPMRWWLLRREVKIRVAHFPLIGAAFGGLSALVGSVGPMMTPFFLGHGLRRGAYIATDALCTLGMYLPRGVVFQRLNLLTGSTVIVGLALGACMIAGAWTGRRLVDRLSERAFLRLIEGLLLVIGLKFLFWPAQ